MKSLPVLTTPRLVLRALRGDDAEALHTALADAELMRWWSSGPHASLAETRDYLAPHLEGEGWRDWAITRRGDDTALGWISTGYKRDGVSELGYLLARPAWRQGIAREAAGRVIDHLFGDEGQRRLFADVDPDNAASVALLTRLGFTLEGRLRGEWETHIGVRDSLIFGLLAQEWRG